MELAKLFATVGFKVDKEGLTAFRAEIADLKVQLKEAAIQTGKLKNQLTGLTAQFKAFQKITDTKGVTKWMEGIEKSVVHLNNMQVAVSGQAQKSEMWADRFSASIFKLHQAITGRKNEVAEYAQAIMLLAANFERLKAATAGIGRFRQVPSSAISNTGAGYGGARQGAGRRGGSGNGYESNQYVGYWGRASGIAKSPMAAMLRPMLPTGMGLFNAVAGGYAIKELIATGREMMAMENMLKAISGDTATFNSNLKFVKETADELGISILDMGQSYSKMFMSGKDHFGTQVLQKSFKGAQSYFRLLGMSAEKINLANKAIEQMFNKQKVSSEELKGQLGEHAAGVMQYFAQAAGTDVQGLFKMMENGKVGTDVVVKAMEAMGNFALSSPEFQKQLKMSAAAQERFNNKMREFSKVMMESGLDELLTEMFGILNKIVTVMTPLFKGLVYVIQAVKKAVSALWDMKEVLIVLGLGLVAANLTAIAAGVQSIITVMRILGPLLAGAALSAGALYATLAGFVYVFASIDDYMKGERNWVYGLQLMLEIAMAKLDQFQLRVQIWWKQMKGMWEGFQLDPSKFIKDNAFDMWYKNQDPLTRWIVDKVGDIKRGGITFGGDAASPYPTPPNVQQNRYAPNMLPDSPLIIHIDASKVAGAQNDPEKFGKAVGGEVVSEWQRVMGGLGIYK